MYNTKMKKLTIIMPFLNEGDEPRATIESIYDTAPSELFKVIAIDDGSTQPPNLNGFEDVRFIRNKVRMGVDGCRQMGAEMADTPYIFIIDAHMRFKNDKWMEKMIDCLEREPETAWCTTCLGLGYGSMDMNNHKGKYKAANMLLIDKNANPNRPSREVLEPKWSNNNQDGEYEVPCILGANYGFSKQWFTHIRGLQGLQMWGTSEPFLSMKTWMAGGKCKITTDVEIGHKFRSNAPYATGIKYLVYNKIFLCKTILPEDVGDKLIDCLPKDVNFNNAMKSIEQNRDIIEENRRYYQGIFKSSIYDYCEKFKIGLP